MSVPDRTQSWTEVQTHCVCRITDTHSDIVKDGVSIQQENAMHLFIRTVRVKNAASMPAAVQFAASICAYVNKAYPTHMKFGVEVFGHARIYWLIEFDSVDQSLAMNQRMLMDPEYQALLNKGKDLWVEGGLKDKLVQLHS
jgi:hypothetical protein